MQYFDKVVYTFSADNEPTGTIDSGEIVIFRTQDCFSNQMHSESQLVTSCDYSKMNPATGPLFVRDAQPGDVIKVELLDVQCDTIGRSAPSGTSARPAPSASPSRTARPSSMT